MLKVLEPWKREKYQGTGDTYYARRGVNRAAYVYGTLTKVRTKPSSPVRYSILAWDTEDGLANISLSGRLYRLATAKKRVDTFLRKVGFYLL